MLVDGKLDISTTGAPMMFKTFAQKWLDGYVENNLKWNSRRYYADMIRRIPDDLQRKTRITSYNVCYTKLLRAPLAPMRAVPPGSYDLKLYGGNAGLDTLPNNFV